MRDVRRCVIEPVRKGEPLTRWSKLVAIRRGVTTVEDGAEVIVAQIFRNDAGDIGLDDLSDLLLERHGRDHYIETGLERGIGGERGLDRGPLVGMHDGCGRRTSNGRHSCGGQGHNQTDCPADAARNSHRAIAISPVRRRSAVRGLIAPRPDCPDVHREEALTMDVVPIYDRDSDQHPTLMTALSMN